MYKPSSAYITKNVTIFRHHAEVLAVMVLDIQQIIFLKLLCFLDHDYIHAEMSDVILLYIHKHLHHNVTSQIL